jgi:hypothetical protein
MAWAVVRATRQGSTICGLFFARDLRSGDQPCPYSRRPPAKFLAFLSLVYCGNLRANIRHNNRFRPAVSWTGTATSPKYTEVSVFFYIGLVGLAVSLYDVWTADNKIGFASGLIIGLFVAVWLTTFSDRLTHAKIIREDRKDLAMAVQWIRVIPGNPDLALSYKSPELIVARTLALSEYDALRPRLISPSLASMVHERPPDGDSSAGGLETARFGDGHRLLLTGTAWLTYRNGRPDCIVVGYTNEVGGLKPFTVFQPTFTRERIKRDFPFIHPSAHGFAASVDPGNLPRGKLVLRAWAVDLKAERAFPMAGVLPLNNDPIDQN